MLKKKIKLIRGFTLIEIMVVLFIFSLILTMATISTNFQYTGTVKLNNTAKTIVAKIKLAKQEAVLQHSTLRFISEGNAYEFQRLGIKGNWDHMKNNSILAHTFVGQKTLISMSKEVEFYPNGSFTPFEISINYSNNKSTVTIFGDKDGNIGLIKHENE